DSAGYQLHLLQMGEQPTDWKPVQGIGQGVQEIRIQETSGAFRVIYVARFEEAVYVLHVFQKKTQKTAQSDIELARDRFKAMIKRRTT
ncbi:MAG: type II toxin-antitoxin system RelE/ParE family toxin, partial [Thiothrix sp.]|nr:type II toxin-antitoxin system RelE/ParE family toxin [Thiothrix sp.]